MPNHPPCGLYRTTRPLEGVPAGSLVYFHNHGDPGPGLYTPHGWNLNRAQWHERGTTVPNAEWAGSLEPLPAEGLYRVEATFHCCEKKCTQFEAGQLVQLGYDGQANAIVFVPEWTSRGLGFPDRGSRVDRERLAKLSKLSVAQGADDVPKHSLMH